MTKTITVAAEENNKLPILLLSKAEVAEVVNTAIDAYNNTTTRKELDNYRPLNILFQRLEQAQTDRAIQYRRWYNNNKRRETPLEDFECLFGSVEDGLG